MKAFCFKSGPIEFGPRTPSGAIEIASGPKQAVRDLIDGTAHIFWPRHGQVKYHVPGTLPRLGEITEQARFDAVKAYVKRLGHMKPVGILIGGAVAEGEVVSDTLMGAHADYNTYVEGVGGNG